MISFETFLLFMIPVLLLGLSPGPGMLFVASRALAQGRTMGIVSVFGLELGAVIHVIAATLGLSAIIVANPHLLILIQLFGGVYLIYLAMREWHLKKINRHVASEHFKKDSAWQIFKQGIITSLVNPKITLFFFAFLPSFIDPNKNVPAQFLILGIIFNITGIIINSAVVFIVAQVGQSRFLRGSGGSHFKSWVLISVFFGLGCITLLDACRRIWQMYF